MKKLENSFVVSGYIVKDAEIRNFKSASVARFPISISRPETKGNETVYHSAIVTIEAWKKNENTAEFDLLKKGTVITVEGYFRPEEWEKDGKKQSRIVFLATKFYPASDK